MHERYKQQRGGVAVIGHDLAGRYEIISRIGGGGMALVYKAQDLLLNRKVAIKVLRQQFVNDDEFIRRFRREAQSAAALSHPNVVSIYDVGQEDDTHYIVMEYIEGRNLNEIIAESAPLQVEQAVNIAYQIADALDHAHANQIIHRDIKPHNILIGSNGRIKVTDFGIARAVTSSTITHTGSVVGSVHYFSPEHAKGVHTGEKSDLYSLGIVLYQMLTNALPFQGESPISIALKHLQDDFADPKTINPYIPQSVENIILRAMRKDPNERYESAANMMQDLATCLEPARLNEPKLTFAKPYADDLEETKVLPAIRGNFTERYQATKPLHTETVSYATNEFNTKELEEKTSWKKPLIIASITLVLLALLVFGFFKLINKLDTDEVQIPDVVGMTEKEAVQIIEDAGLNVFRPITYEESKTVPQDIVISQSKSNMKVKLDSYIELTVSLGPELKAMPSYLGSDKVAAQNALSALGISPDQITFTEINNEAEAGTILEQTPAPGEEVNIETVEINFTVSAGPEKVTIIDFTDMRLKDVRSWIIANGLVLEEQNIKYQSSYLHEKDFVVSQGKATPNSEITKGTSIELVVSSGYPEDARTYQLNVRISPATTSATSEIKIYYSDARGENVQMDPKKINSTITIPVTLVLDPDTIAKVIVYRDGSFVDSKEIRYNDVSSGQSDGFNLDQQETTIDPIDSNQSSTGPDGSEDTGESKVNEQEDTETQP